MGDRLVTDLFSLSSWNANPRKTEAQIFADLCPTYLAIGMTYDQYWHGAAEVAAYYRKAYLLKQKERNHELWLQGMYIYEALLDVSPVMTAFRGKNAKPMPYSQEPYPITQQEVMERKERQERQEQEKLRAALEAWAKKTNAQFAAMKNDQSPMEVNDTDG